MREAHFLQLLDGIYAAFDRKQPDERVRKAIFARVESLPDGFMDYAAMRLGDYEALPRNLGAHLLHELWPDYRQANPEICAPNRHEGCSECGSKTPGLLFGWDKYGLRMAFRCACVGGGWTRERIEQAGYSLAKPAANPDVDWRRWKMPERIRCAIGRDEPPRERHLEQLERMEAGQW